MHNAGPNQTVTLERIFVLLCALLVISYAWALGSYALSHALPFDADEAHHAARGLDLYVALKNLSAWQIWEALKDQAFYPPLHSVFVALSYLVLGPSESASRLPTWLILFATLVLTLSALCLSISAMASRSAAPVRSVGYITGIVVILAFFTPILLQNASLCMLELPSAMLTAAILYFFAVRLDPFSLRSISILSVLLFASALTKYTLIGCVVAPALLSLLRPFERSAGICGAFQRSLLPAFLAGLGFSLLFGAWLLLARADGVAFFLFGFHKRGMRFDLDHLLTYPQVFIERCGLFPVIALAILMLVALSFVYVRRQRAVLFAWLCVAISLLLLSVSRQQGARYIIQLLPCIWFLAGVGLFRLFEIFRKKQRGSVGSALLAFTILFLVAWSAIRKLPQFKDDSLRFMETTQTSVQMIELVLKHSDARQPILLFGSSDRLNSDALRWSLANRAGLAYREIELYEYPFSDELFLKTWYSQPWRRPLEGYQTTIGGSLSQVLERFKIKTLIVYGINTRFRKRIEEQTVKTLLFRFPSWSFSDGESSIAVIDLY